MASKKKVDDNPYDPNKDCIIDVTTSVVDKADAPNIDDFQNQELVIEQLRGDVLSLLGSLCATRKLIFVMSKHVGADNALIQAGVDPSELHRLTARELKGKR